MSGLLTSKTINNESSVVNSGTNLVVNSITTLSTTDAITTGPIVSSGGITSSSLNTGAIVSSGAITSNSLTTSGNIVSTSGNITSNSLYSDRLYITNGLTTFTQSSLYLDVPNKFLNIYGYFTTDDVYNQRKIKLRDYVELKYLYATHGIAINTTPDNFTYKLNVNGNANISGYVDIGGNINNGSNTLTTGAITSTTGSISINPSSGISSLYLDTFYIRREANNNITYYTNGNTLHAFYTNNIIRMTLDGGGLALTVPIYAGSNSVNCGGINSIGNFSNGGNSLTTGVITCSGLSSSGTINAVGSLTASSLSISGAITSTSTVTTTGLITNSIVSSGTNGPLVIDPNYSTNNHVLIHDKLVVSGNIENGANSVQTGRIHGNGNLYITSNTVLENGASIWASNFYNNSDDRIKNNEVVITNATETLLKLRPEMYDKYSNFELTGGFTRDAGIIAQELYNIEELRFLVSVPIDASGDLTTTNSTNPQNDPNLDNWGSTPASVNYLGLIPFLIKSIQELNQRIYDLEHP